jgi:Ca2+-binding EF-hand superfamily protein
MFTHAKNLSLASTVAVLLIPAHVHAQETWTYTDWDDDGNLELSSHEFNAGLSDSGVHGAWDRDDDAGLNEGEFATGMFSNWDMDNDLQISEEEYTAGTDRWYDASFDTPFTNYDVDSSGYISRSEFGEGWQNDTFTVWDGDSDGLITNDEFSTGAFNSADLDDDKVITVEEEGWFEGWFDGDDVEAEIEEVGDVV